MSNNRQGDYLHIIEARLQARTDTQPLTVFCALCPWSMVGTTGELLASQREHRETAHGIKRIHTRKSTRHLNSFRIPDLTADELAEIASEVERRKLLHGIEA